MAVSITHPTDDGRCVWERETSMGGGGPYPLKQTMNDKTWKWIINLGSSRRAGGRVNAPQGPSNKSAAVPVPFQDGTAARSLVESSVYVDSRHCRPKFDLAHSLEITSSRWVSAAALRCSRQKQSSLPNLTEVSLRAEREREGGGRRTLNPPGTFKSPIWPQRKNPTKAKNRGWRVRSEVLTRRDPQLYAESRPRPTPPRYSKARFCTWLGKRRNHTPVCWVARNHQMDKRASNTHTQTHFF